MFFSKFTFLIILLVLLGCSTNGNKDYSGSSGVQNKFQSGRHIIRSASLSLSVESIEQVALKVSDLVERHDGYIKSDNRYSDDRIHMDLKIPSEKLDTFVSELSSLGRVTEKSTRSRDVTAEVIDISARLQNLIALRARYRELLNKANTVEEMMSIERELSQIQTEIDSMEGRKASLLDQVEMSAVDVTLKQEAVYGPVGYLGKGLLWVIGKLFVIK